MFAPRARHDVATGAGYRAITATPLLQITVPLPRSRTRNSRRSALEALSFYARIIGMDDQEKYAQKKFLYGCKL
jgi:hypothetical protein